MPISRSAVSALAILAATAGAAAARDQVQVAGSSTVLPYASIVAEAFGENFDFPTPVVESGGSSAGLKRFCEGVGENTIDIANASRAIRDSELEACRAAGVTDIIEVRIGYDGIVFASQQDGPAFTAFEPADIYNALAAKVVKDGEVVDNSYDTWSEFNSDLPDAQIAAFIPGTKHGTREVFEEQVILQGCEDSGAMEQIMEINGGDEDAAEEACMAPLSSQPCRITFSSNTSRVPCLVPGMKAMISASGRLPSTSDQVVLGLVVISPSIGISAARAVYHWAGSKAVNSGPSIWLAKTMPS